MANAVGICAPWADVADVSCTTLDPAAVEEALWLASEILYNLTGGVWPGECEETIRPVAKAWCAGRVGLYPFVGVDGAWSTWSGPGWNPSPADQDWSHSSRWLSEIRLPSTPVVSITEVRLDGAVLLADRYRIANRRSLVMTPQPGDQWQGWPAFQDDHLDDTEPGTFSVKYKYGFGPPRAGAIMAARYGCQIALSGTAECKLPERVQTISRQGVSMTVLDPLDFIQNGQVGLPIVDNWVGSVWARRKRRRSTVTALDRRKRVRRDTVEPSP